jgi:hypothetical protein
MNLSPLETLLLMSTVAITITYLMERKRADMFRNMRNVADEAFDTYADKSKALVTSMQSNYDEVKERLELTVIERDRLYTLMKSQHTSMVETSACMHASIQALDTVGYTIDFAPNGEEMLVKLMPKDAELADVHFKANPRH